jgi:hypothetical protein
MTTRGPSWPRARVICRVASSPSIPGIRMSISTTSGAFSATAATAPAPFAASPTTLMPSAASRITQKPARTSSWSSTTSTRIGRATSVAVRSVVLIMGGSFTGPAAGR